MKIRLLLIAIILSGFTGSIAAEARYVSDSLDVFVRSGPTKNFRIVGTIKSGEEVQLLQEDIENAASQIRLEDGREVWIDTAQLIADKPVHVTLSETRSEYRNYRQTAEAQITTLRGDLLRAQELANASERLQKRIAELELANEGLELRNETLSDRSRYDLLTAGGIVAIVGVFVGLLLPKIIGRRRDDGWR